MYMDAVATLAAISAAVLCVYQQGLDSRDAKIWCSGIAESKDRRHRA